MIYLSAQPDDYYFLWQLQLQLYNLHKIGIPANNIHILIGFNPRYGLNSPFLKFINQCNELASFFIYEDTRTTSKYPSSIRPHIISKHFLKYPHLKGETIFYHDSDILIREQIKLSLPVGHHTWYASDTTSYTGLDCVLSSVPYGVFDEMCSIIGVNPSIVLTCEGKGGGAQYILTGTDWQFWKKVESYCEKIYTFLRDLNYCTPTIVLDNVTTRKLDCWLTDIWVLRWNALLIGYNVLVHDELDFCWISSPINRWDETKILHYTGINDVFSEKLFIKSRYKIHSPFHDDFSKIDKGTCSGIMVDYIHEYNVETNCIHFPHSVMIVEQNSSNPHIIDIMVSYLNDFGMRVLLVGDDINKHYPSNVTIIPSWNLLSHYILKHSEIYNFIIAPNNCILPIYCLKYILESTFDETKQKIFRIIGTGYRLDLLTKYIFEKSLDDGFLSENKGKFKKVCQLEMATCDDWARHLVVKLFNIGDNLFYL